MKKVWKMVSSTEILLPGDCGKRESCTTPGMPLVQVEKLLCSAPRERCVVNPFGQAGNQGVPLHVTPYPSKQLHLQDSTFPPPPLPSNKLDLQDSAFTDNRALGTSGGAVSAENGSDVTAARCVFADNQAGGGGGGVYGTGEETRVTVESSSFTGNAAEKVGGGLRAFLLGVLRTER